MTSRMRASLGAGAASGALMALVMVVALSAPPALSVVATAVVAVAGFLSYYYLRPLVA